MPIITSLIRLSLNCAKHKDDFHNVENKCDACRFLIHYNQRILTLQKEAETLNKDLEEFLKTNKVVAVTLGGSFMQGKL